MARPGRRAECQVGLFSTWPRWLELGRIGDIFDPGILGHRLNSAVVLCRIARLRAEASQVWRWTLRGVLIREVQTGSAKPPVAPRNERDHDEDTDHPIHRLNHSLLGQDDPALGVC